MKGDRLMYKYCRYGKLVETSEGRECTGLSVWDVFEEYADVRDELEDLLEGFRSLQEDIELTVFDLADSLEAVEGHLARCDKGFRRFKAKRRHEETEVKDKSQAPYPGQKEAMPFDEDPQPSEAAISLV